MGTLYYDGDRQPQVGDPVLIYVDDANRPTGWWWGELVRIDGEPGVASDHSLPNCRGSSWVSATAKITDPRASNDVVAREYVGGAPHANYTIYPAPVVAHGTIRQLQRRIDEGLAEIRGLRRRLDIEREAFHGALRALVDRAEASTLIGRLSALLDRVSPAR